MFALLHLDGIQLLPPLQQREHNLVREGWYDAGVRETADGRCKFKSIEGPQSFNESPEALLEVYAACESRGKLIIFVLLRRQVFEQVEDQAMLVVQCGFGGNDALVEVVELLWCFGRISFAPYYCQLILQRMSFRAVEAPTFDLQKI